MLNEQDVQFIKDTRKQIVMMRTEPLILVQNVLSNVIDPLTGERIGGTIEVASEATWSNLTSGGAGSDDIVMVGGVVAEAGDAIANFDIDVDLTGVERVIRRGIAWRIRSNDTVGLGGDNRHYVLLRRVT